MASTKLTDIGILIVRVTLGVIFVAHGLQRLVGAFDGPGINGTIAMLDSIGIAPPQIWAWVLAFSETFGGLFLILGIFPKLAALAIAIIMAIVIVKVHGPKGLFLTKGGFEYQLLILSVSLSLMFTGGGKYSLLNKL